MRWGESLVDFPKVSTVGKIAAVAMRFTLREIPFSFYVAVFWDFDRETLGIKVAPGEAASAVKALMGPTHTIIDHRSRPADITDSAISIVRGAPAQQAQRPIAGTGSAVGDPRLRAGAIVELDQLGPDSAATGARHATHAIDASGYRTAPLRAKEILAMIEGFLDGLDSSIEDLQKKFYGLCTGRVIALDDPWMLGRVQVQLPFIDSLDLRAVGPDRHPDGQQVQRTLLHPADT